MTDPKHLNALMERVTRITGYKYASRDQGLLNCDLGSISLGDLADLCSAITDLQTLLARVLVMDRGSAEEAAEALGGLPEVIRRVDIHHATHPRPSHPTASPDPDEVEF